jgi:hypothetical protein
VRCRSRATNVAALRKSFVTRRAAPAVVISGLKRLPEWIRRFQSTLRDLARRDLAPAANAIEPTSVTDRSSYLDLCAAASSDPSVFENFRRHPVYVDALEHVTYEQGREYINAIRRIRPDLLKKWVDAARGNDAYGSPVTFDYPGFGQLSPVTLRYLKVLADLETIFGDLTNRDIVEIGVGYGGQCRLIVERWAIRSYTLIDLGSPLDLARTYLSQFGLGQPGGPVRFRSSGDETTQESDVLISNYAFSELARSEQERYADLMIKNARGGYMTCNFVSATRGINSMNRDELQALRAGARWMPEEPLTYVGNAILVWGSADKPATPS